MLLSLAANKPPHDPYSANLIELGLHQVMSADRAAIVLVLLRRKRKGESSHFLSGTFAEQISPQLSAVVKFQSQRKQGNSLVHVFGCLRQWLELGGVHCRMGE